MSTQIPKDLSPSSSQNLFASHFCITFKKIRIEKNGIFENGKTVTVIYIPLSQILLPKFKYIKIPHNVNDNEFLNNVNRESQSLSSCKLVQNRCQMTSSSTILRALRRQERIPDLRDYSSSKQYQKRYMTNTSSFMYNELKHLWFSLSQKQSMRYALLYNSKSTKHVLTIFFNLDTSTGARKQSSHHNR